MNKSPYKGLIVNAVLIGVVGILGYVLSAYFKERPPTVTSVPVAVRSNPNTLKFPDFSFTDLKGKTYESTDFKDKILIVNFWASWCPPCLKEFPALLNAAAKNPDIVLIAFSSDHDRNALTGFLNTLGGNPARQKNVILAMDEKGRITRELFQTYRLPETILVGRDGLLKHKLIGADWQPDDLQSLVDELR
ncbi:MAG: TlpA family protein disulfide reductase [Alphaproteobacteria bacterium]|nr:TlpA family protein disulfide reductase [Alphaproteobacteria bacterium]